MTKEENLIKATYICESAAYQASPPTWVLLRGWACRWKQSGSLTSPSQPGFSLCDPSAEVRSLLDRQVDRVEAGMSSRSFCSPPLCVYQFLPPPHIRSCLAELWQYQQSICSGLVGGGLYNLAELDLGGRRGGAPAGQWRLVVRFKDLLPSTLVLVCPLLPLNLPKLPCSYLLTLTIQLRPHSAEFQAALNQF